ncbi:origin recognition complex subunit 2 [Annulohypoxylon maeteangense]|uniref:origin recognition complex subunit 2 n=1 Tax=Annulohypoxylon maeteangense TaxID=1927788 RepID=UPI0020080FFA|nr:origin recognition complex subunit 2 [Annulohypoxylon maeteangense]KAI0884325.1 origin recognition complex subunit 2 [Annulohypoxylon maeteangense]
MVRTKKPIAEPGPKSRGSRKRTQDEDESNKDIPTKRRSGRETATSNSNIIAGSHRSEYDFPSDEDDVASPVKKTPSKKKQLPTASTPKNIEVSTPRGRKRNGADLATPSKTNGSTAQTPRWKRNDRSARKKSARALIEQVVGENGSDEEADEDIAREIFESSEDEEDEEGEESDNIPEEPATPSGKPRRGRPKTKLTTKRARKKSPTPPRDLPPHELYFAQNRPGASKTSSNNITSLKLLTHDEYFSILRDYTDPHAEDVEFLESIHVESFPQWIFELTQGFSICLYGYGSKRGLLHQFAKYTYEKYSDHIANKIVIINGYVRTSSLREILGTVAGAVNPAHKVPAGNPSAMLDSVKSLLSSHDVVVTVILNSIDALPLRKVGTQSILAQLAAHPNIRLICSADTPDFPLLWDSSLRSSFNFVFHDCTTFAPFTAELEVVDDVHELLGRKARRVGGKEGVAYVLRSLPENAKNLFRLLVGEVLVVMDDGSDGENSGVEYRMVYNKAVEEFICSSEMAFRTLLKECVPLPFYTRNM